MRISKAALAMLVLTVVTATALGACGGDDDDGGDVESFIADADEICIEGARETTAISEEQGASFTAADELETVERQAPVRAQVTEDLSALEPPDEAADQFEQYLSIRERLAENDQAYIAALEEEAQQPGGGTERPPQEVLDIQAEYDDLTDELTTVAEQIGLEACATQLPAEDEEQVRESVETTFTQSDPTFCTEQYTESFVEEFAGGIEECREAESDPAGAAEAVEINEVRGVEGVWASAEIVAVHPERGEESLRVDMVYEDGTYKRDAIAQGPELEPAT